MTATGFPSEPREIPGIYQRRLCLRTVFRDSHGKECSTYLSFCSTICADSLSCLCTLFRFISSNLTRGTWAIVSLAIIGDGDLKRWGQDQFHCTLTRWPALLKCCVRPRASCLGVGHEWR